MSLLPKLRSTMRTQRELNTARAQLLSTRVAYRAGAYSGHPEETLELREGHQNRVNLLARIITEGRVLDWEAVDSAQQARFELRESNSHISFFDLPQSYFEAMNEAHEVVERAWATDLKAA